MSEKIKITPELIEKLQVFQKGHEWREDDRIIYGEWVGRVHGVSSNDDEQVLLISGAYLLIKDIIYYPTEGDLMDMLRGLPLSEFNVFPNNGGWRIDVVLDKPSNGYEFSYEEFRHSNYYTCLLKAVRGAVYGIDEEE